MSTVYHDTYWFSPNVDWGPVNQQVMLTALRNALKPGGVVAVLDHYAESRYGCDAARHGEFCAASPSGFIAPLL